MWDIHFKDNSYNLVIKGNRLKRGISYNKKSHIQSGNKNLVYTGLRMNDIGRTDDRSTLLDQK